MPAVRRYWVLAILSYISGYAGPALSQSSAPGAGPPGSNPNDSQKLEEVIVTATRRAERLQDVPLSVVAVSGDTLANREVLNLTDISYLAPSVTYSGVNPAGGGFTIRGVGIGNYSPAVEQSVAIVVDGIVMAIQGAGIGLLSDIERVEVLNGPQGTTFGKNASAGVINIITRAPSFDGFSVDAHAEYGQPTGSSFGHNGLSLVRSSVNIPMSSSVAATLSAFKGDDAGNMLNVTQGRNVNTQYQEGGRAKVLWKASDDFDLTVIGDYRDSQGDCCYSSFLHLNPGSLLSKAMVGTGVVPGPDNLQVALDGADYLDVIDRGVSAEANYRIKGYTWTSILGVRDYATSYNEDTDNTPLPLFSVNAVKEYVNNQITAETRVTSPSDQAFEFVSGLYFFKKHTYMQGAGYVIGTFGQPLPPGVLLAPEGQLDLDFTDQTEAVFGQGTYHVTDKLSLIAGLRYTHGQYYYQTTQIPIPGYPGLPPNFFFQVAGEPTASNVSWKYELQYTWSRNLMMYASATRGYKGPTPLLTAFGQGNQYGLSKPEIPTAYELGLKATLLDDRLIVDADVFDEKVQDFQTSVFDPTTTPPAFRVTNAGELDSRGVEVQVMAKPINRLSLSEAITYDDAYYGSFVGNACYVGQTAAQGCMPVPGTSSSVFNSTGYPIDGVSKWIFSSNADYSLPVWNKESLFFNVNYYARSESYSSDGNPIGNIPSYGLLGGRIGIGETGGRWLVSAYVRNLLDKNYGGMSNPLFGQPGEELMAHPRDAQRLVGLSFDVRL
jgi:iron complex outermembrane recepter protein